MSGNSMRGDQMMWIKLAKELYSPVLQAKGIIDSEFQPVHAFGITGEALWRFHIIPGLVAKPLQVFPTVASEPYRVRSHSRSLALVPSQ